MKSYGGSKPINNVNETKKKRKKQTRASTKQYFCIGKEIETKKETKSILI